MSFSTVTDPHASRISLRIRPADKAALKEAADRAGKSLSAYLVACGLGRKLRSRVDDRAINELRRLGGLLKVAITTDPGQRSGYRALLDELKVTIARLDQGNAGAD